jgi:hypothetical protein
VEAVDYDDHVNGLIRYFLEESHLYDQTYASYLFKINSRLGMISVKENISLDFELCKLFDLVVRAQDCSRKPIPVFTVVRIHYEFFDEILLNYNKNDNTLMDDDLTVNLSISIRSNSNIGRIFVNDADSNLNGEVEVVLTVYKISDKKYNLQALKNTDFAIVFIDNSYYIRTNVAFDKPSVEYLLEISATDIDIHERHTSFLRIKVNIFDSFNDISSNDPFRNQNDTSDETQVTHSSNAHVTTGDDILKDPHASYQPFTPFDYAFTTVPIKTTETISSKQASKTVALNKSTIETSLKTTV